MTISGHCLCKAVTFTVDIEKPLLVGKLGPPPAFASIRPATPVLRVVGFEATESCVC